MNSRQAYIVERALHWIAAITMLLMLMSMYSAIHTTNWQIKGEALHRQDALTFHIALAIVLGLAMSLRLIWILVFKDREVQTEPKSNLHRCFIHLVHIALYGTLATLLVTGVIMSLNYEFSFEVFGFISIGSEQASMQRFEEANLLHEAAIDVLYYLIAIHVAGALYNRK